MIFFLLVLGFLLLTYLQNNTLTTREIPVLDSRIPREFDGFRIVLLSDGHGKQFGPGYSGLLRQVAELSPDLIVYTGDMADSSTELSGLPGLSRGLSNIAPTYYVTGNHEWEIRQVPKITRILKENGASVLQNQFVTLTRGKQSIVLAGVNDPNGPKDQKTPEQLASQIRNRYFNSFVILLAHRNNLFSKYAACGYDLVLSGHAHGGLVRLPFTDGLIDSQHTLFPTWTSGLYSLGNTQMVVSRGLGNIKPSFRVFNPPDIPVVVLHPKAS
ncbi:MAG: metallophosphoesterase [Oscillospiraceae bacterium]|nr:metallophosphoesterase [Oscillospiraceae bacterium]